MSKQFCFLPKALCLLALLVMAFGAAPAQAAADLPTADSSTLSGVNFVDKPLVLPLQKNFQVAMMTAANELGRSCGRSEAYGWRMSQSEQGRVDEIFNATVDRFRAQGYDVTMQNPTSISKDITMFTADRPNKHFLSMWSAGDIGLVMVLCETSQVGKSRGAALSANLAPSVETFIDDVPLQPKNIAQSSYSNFSPSGTWVGSYICGQGYTGVTMTINQLHGSKFEGQFHFYPTARNRSVPDGSYTIYGDYDRASQRILINPGHWIKRPSNYYNTIIVGSFDVMTPQLSAYFQGITGCTSIELKHPGSTVKEKAAVAKRKVVVKKSVKPVAKKAAVKTKAVPKLEDMLVKPSSDAAPAATDEPPPPPVADAPPPAKSEKKLDTKSDKGSDKLSDADEKPPLVVGAPTTGEPSMPPAPPISPATSH